MNKESYLTEIRQSTAYPTYRRIIGILTGLGYVLAGLVVVAALVFGLGMMAKSATAGLFVLLGGAVNGAILYFLSRFWKEASLILADIGDSITAANAKNEEAGK